MVRDGFVHEEDRTPYSEHTDLKTVESQRHDLALEEFPEGPYGATTDEDTLGKETPWLQDQRSSPRFSYENREFHQSLPRHDYPAHPTHDDPYRDDEQP